MWASVKSFFWELFWYVENGLVIVLVLAVLFGAVKLWCLLLLWCKIHAAHPILICTVVVFITVFGLGILADEHL